MKAVPFAVKSQNAFLLILLCFSAAVFAAPPKEALLIANGKYSHFAGLAHPSPDAAKLSAALEQLGFRVRVVRDGNREQMLDAISEFERGLRNTGAIAFFHYGGHGVQVDGKNYLLPADADIPDERRVATRAVALDEVMTAMDASAARASIIVIDACRDNPLPAGSGRNLTRGLSVVGLKPKNSIVIYAAEAGSKALDGLFTPILATALQEKGRTIDQVMKKVRSEVYAKSSGQQTPGEYNQLFEELILGETDRENDSLQAIIAPTRKTSATPTKDFDSNKPTIEEGMVMVEGGTLPAVSQLSGIQVKSFLIGRTEVTCQEWNKVNSWAVKHGYDFGGWKKTTSDYLNAFMKGNDQPYDDANWYDCLKWCNAKSEMEGLEPVYEVDGKVYRTGEYGSKGSEIVTQVAGANGYRIPTEAEWEWAARGGVKSQGYKYSGSNFVNLVAWYEDNSDASGKKAVATKSANELGIYDMSGNVLEWCWDRFMGDRIVRGGGWLLDEYYCAVASRDSRQADCPSYGMSGFRLARSVTEKSDMVFVECGTLPVGSKFREKNVKSFYIGRTEVTWLQWKKVRNWASDHGYDIGNIGEGKGDNYPAQNVNWYDCVKWCNAQSEMHGLIPVYQVRGKVYRSGDYGKYGSSVVSELADASGYRLPSEAEWAWAASGGVKSESYEYSGSNDIETIGWYRDNSSSTAHQVGQKKPNELGIYDMSGNVSEWCSDFDGTERRILGGSLQDLAWPISFSLPICPALRLPPYGLRFARSL